LHRARHTSVFAVTTGALAKGSNAAAVPKQFTAPAGRGVRCASLDGAVRRLSPLDAADRIVSTMLIVDNCEHVLAGAGR